MSSVIYNSWDDKWYMQWKEWDPAISVVVGLDEKYQEGMNSATACFYLTYKEFIELADFLGFDCVPRDYRMQLSNITEKGDPA